MPEIIDYDDAREDEADADINEQFERPSPGPDHTVELVMQEGWVAIVRDKVDEFVGSVMLPVSAREEQIVGAIAFFYTGPRKDSAPAPFKRGDRVIWTTTRGLEFKGYTLIPEQMILAVVKDAQR